MSILRQIRLRLPSEDLIYFADQAHVPYGAKSPLEVRGYTEDITQFLLRNNAKIIVVACNTTSAVALHHLRHLHPQILIVGMEPAVKPAAHITRTGKIGVLATLSTFQGELFASVLEQFGEGVTVFESTLLGLVERIEVGDIDSPLTKRIVQESLNPLISVRIPWY